MDRPVRDKKSPDREDPGEGRSAKYADRDGTDGGAGLPAPQSA
ncbi:hypothetical protein SAMCFNEI73_Ch3578 [Sinorhizobium americanum]|uniref:Uncharacterized protein n=1 Tax=Sinorhizobium americanum TaxID=194963 RepID=A0A1L3LRW5_9HYPH|nr:hypothetical protein SAMCCGM7_Ch3476 [Sinorhizobium americanum CCGM7]APG92828.1 hypothetical protein SAMCFNEI73_Ch3578 [Sinorhizobium americanum]